MFFVVLMSMFIRKIADRKTWKKSGNLRMVRENRKSQGKCVPA